MTQKNSCNSTKHSREVLMAKIRISWVKFLARLEQLPPEDDSWTCFCLFAGRGAGKTRMAAEWLVWQCIKSPKTRWAIIAPTMSSCISVCVEGESGLLSVLKRYGFHYEFLRSRQEILLENGTLVSIYSAEEPERIRGPQFHGAWFDELAAFSSTEIYDLALPALRLGSNPQHIITTTPKPIPLILKLAKVPSEYRIVRTGSTFDNEKNLAPSMIRDLKESYGSSRLARQELYGEILNQLDGALFSVDHIDQNRSSKSLEQLSFYRVRIGVDPAVTSGEDADLTGISVVGQTADGHCYVLEDASMRGKPEEWSAAVSDLYKKYSRKYLRPMVIAESNNGGEMVESVLKMENPYLQVQLVTASKGKALRAEPVSIAYSKGLIHHLGNFPELENEMLYWIPGKSSNSPNRLDALIWALTDFIERPSYSIKYFMGISKTCVRCGNIFHKRFDVCPSCHALAC